MDPLWRITFFEVSVQCPVNGQLRVNGLLNSFPAHFGQSKPVRGFAVAYEHGAQLAEIYMALAGQMTLALLHHPDFREEGKAARRARGEEAAAAFRDRYEDDELFQGLPDNNFNHRFAIDLADIGYMRETKEALEALPGIESVQAYEDEAAGFITIRNVAGVVCVVLIAVLALVSVFIMANTIKLTTFDRRDEIAIMKMVGATNGFIRWPFVYEGFLMGFLGASVAFLMEWGLYEAVAQGVSTSDAMQLIEVIPFKELWGPVAGSFAGAGIFIGVGGSLSAIRKYLQV